MIRLNGAMAILGHKLHGFVQIFEGARSTGSTPEEDVGRGEIVEQTRALKVVCAGNNDVDNPTSTLIGFFESDIANIFTNGLLKHLNVHQAAFSEQSLDTTSERASWRTSSKSIQTNGPRLESNVHFFVLHHPDETCYNRSR